MTITMTLRAMGVTAACAIALLACGTPPVDDAVGEVCSACKVEDKGKSFEIVPPGQSYRGESQANWGFDWWAWTGSIPFAHSPIADATGAECARNQQGPVWFLAGTNGSSVTRSCTVPEGKALFFPLINYLNDYPCPDPSFQPAPGQSLADFLVDGAKSAIDAVDELHLEIDGVKVNNLWQYRQASGMRTFTADISNQAADPCVTGQPQKGASNGYYVMLKPLDKGKHTIRLGGGITGFNLSIDATYHLTIGK